MIATAPSTGAWWLREQVAARGADLSAWPEATRRAAATLPAADLEAAGLGSVLGAAGGLIPRPYPDPAHLRDSAVPHERNTTGAKAPTGGRARPAEPSAFSAGDRPGDLPPTQLEAAAAALEAVPHGDGSHRGQKRGRPWDKREADRLLELVTREALEAATGRPITDGDGVGAPCGHDGWVFRNVQDSSAFRFQVSTCSKRGRCPHCGRAYGLDQAAELYSLFRATLDRRADPLKPYQAAAWAFVVTLPRPVSAHLGRLADDVRRRKELRAEVTKLNGVARDYARYMFGRTVTDPKTGEVAVVPLPARDLSGAVNVHWWSSTNPTSGYHWHAHVIVPNVARDGAELRRLAKFSHEALERGRAELARLLLKAWPAGFDLEAADGSPAPHPGAWAPNVNARWYLANKAGMRKLRHRSRYDARHTFADLLKLAGGQHAGRVFGRHAEAGLAQLAARVESLQSMKLRRYFGFLVPGSRQAVGLVKPEGERDEDGGPLWVLMDDGYRRIVRWTDEGLVVRRYLAGGQETHATVSEECITYQSHAPPVRWAYEGERDRSRPPA